MNTVGDTTMVWMIIGPTASDDVFADFGIQLFRRLLVEIDDGRNIAFDVVDK